MDKNKKLERRISIITLEYSKNKTDLEDEISRLKLILNNSLIEMGKVMGGGKTTQELKEQLRRNGSENSLASYGKQKERPWYSSKQG